MPKGTAVALFSLLMVSRSGTAIQQETEADHRVGPVNGVSLGGTLLKARPDAIEARAEVVRSCARPLRQQ
jgi:hypothetical protein